MKKDIIYNTCATGRGALLKVQEIDFIQRFRCTTFCGRRLSKMLCEAFLRKCAECVQIFLYSKKIWTEERQRRSGAPGVVRCSKTATEPCAMEGARTKCIGEYG